ncbi:MAG: DUF362 domain-containing protein [Proteobacteria bacterium]|nr:DUF362 domain-containing protein [Pseudomonadota bacterium]
MPSRNPKACVSVDFTGYEETVALAMDRAGAPGALAGCGPVMIKPNLVNDSPFPVTTPPALCEAVIRYVRQHSDVRVVVAEGTGDPSLETMEIFDSLGYTRMASELGVELMDLNTQPLMRMKNEGCQVFPEMHLPQVAFNHFLISVPVLKAHSLAGITGTLKNMMGLAPPKFYSGRWGTWKKAAFHGRMQDAVADLNRYRIPDFTVMDATVGLAEYHLGGPVLDPAPNQILAGQDPWAVDRQAARLLGLDWRAIGHLAARLEAKKTKTKP